MIASGTSILEVATMLKERGANKVFLVATFSLFTEGIEIFNEAYDNKLFSKIYTTNLSYIPEEIKSLEWLEEVDISKYLAKIIDTMNKNGDMQELRKAKIDKKKKN